MLLNMGKTNVRFEKNHVLGTQNKLVQLVHRKQAFGGEKVKLFEHV